jgi:hypothetical protein
MIPIEVKIKGGEAFEQGNIKVNFQPLAVEGYRRQ